MAPDPSSRHLEELDDAELMQAHVSGETAAFGVLFARHRDRLWAVALRTMGNPHDAADGLQDGLISAYRRANTFRGDSAVTTWLHRVIVNACLDRLRAAQSRRTEPIADSLEDGLDRGWSNQSATATKASEDPVEHAISQERKRAVIEALATLPDEQRAALVLVDMEGHSVAEAAAILDVAEGTIKSRCSRGRSKLAQLLCMFRDETHDTAELRNQRPASPVRSEDKPRGPP